MLTGANFTTLVLTTYVFCGEERFHKRAASALSPIIAIDLVKPFSAETKKRSLFWITRFRMTSTGIYNYSTNKIISYLNPIGFVGHSNSMLVSMLMMHSFLCLRIFLSHIYTTIASSSSAESIIGKISFPKVTVSSSISSN